MATILPNQPVIFDASVDLCSTDTDYYTQIVDNTDDTQFQVQISVCNGQEQLLPDPNFADPTDWNLYSGWSIAANQLCKVAGTPSLALTSTYNFTANKYYQVTVEVDSCSSGSEFYVYIGGTFNAGTITSAGTYTFYGFAPLTYPFGISAVTDDSTICISSVTVFEVLTNFIVAIYDTDNNFVNDITYSGNPEYFTFVEDTVTVTINWSELSISNGCYYLCLLDPCENTNGQNYPPVITNDTFTGSATGWTLGASWSYSANAVSATYSAVPPATRNYITSSDVFVNYTSTYSINVNVTAITGSLEVYFGGVLVETITTTGTHLCTGTPNTNLDFYLVIASGTATVTSCVPVTVSSAEYECNYTSNNFKLSDYSGACPETLLINACNDENGLGFVFNGSGFTPRLRLQGKLKQAKYEANRVMEEDSNGVKRVVFYNRRKSKNLVADLLPEYIHDFLSTLIGYDRFYINGTAYVVDDDEYNVTYDDSQDNVGSVSMLVSEQTQLIRNVNCSSDEVSCTIGTNYLLQADDANQNITLVNGELIEING